MSDPQSLLLVQDGIARQLREMRARRAAAPARASRWSLLTAALRRPAMATSAAPAAVCCSTA